MLFYLPRAAGGVPRAQGRPDDLHLREPGHRARRGVVGESKIDIIRQLGQTSDLIVDGVHRRGTSPAERADLVARPREDETFGLRTR